MKRNRIFALATALTLTVAAWGVHAWGAPGRDSLRPEELQPVRLKQATLYMTNELLAASREPVGEGQRSLYIVQFTGPVREEFKSALVRAGAEVGDYLPENSFLVRMGDQTREVVSRLGFVRGIARYQPHLKLDPAVAGQQGGSLRVRVTTFGQSTKSAIGTLGTLGLKPMTLGAGSVTTLASAADLKRLSLSDEVVFIEPVRENALFNDKATEVMNVPAAWSAGLTGEGQVVAITDTGLDNGKNDRTLHPDLAGRVQALFALGRSGDASDTHGHGTHVAGSALGNGAAAGGQNRGAAPAARLVFQSVLDSRGGLSGIPEDLAQLFRQAYQSGARIHTNSWGVPASAGGAGVYDGQAAAADRFIWENPDYTILFAAGNDGDHDNDGKTNFGTVSTPGTAKNVITVGASENLRSDRGRHADNADDVAVFSSRGLTADGRVKPDVVAPGTWILSTKSAVAPVKNFWAAHNDRYAFMGGTSMATPLTAGAVALVRQYYTDTRSVVPRADLLKATLVSGAVPLKGTWSVRDQGWGRVDVASTLYPGDGAGFRFVNGEHALGTGQGQTYTYTVAAGAPLKVTLAWTDFPASPTAAKALVNDLDLTVTGPDGKPVSGNQVLGSGPDRTNNLEQVVIAAPQAGTYTVTVRAHNVPQGPQRYGLVVSGRVDGGRPDPAPPPDPQPDPPGRDTEAPVVALLSPTGGTISGTVTVTVEARDNAGVSKVDLFANGVWVGAATVAPYRITWDTTRVADGSYQLVANAYDAAGNVGKSAPVTVIVRNGAAEAPAELTQLYTDRVGAYGTFTRYFVDLPAGGRLSASIRLLRGWGTIHLFVYDPAGRLVGQGRAGTEAASSDLHNLPAGTYTIVAQYLGGFADYALTVRHTAAETVATATHTGAVSFIGGARLQAIPVRVGSTGALNASLAVAEGRADLDLYLVDPRGQLVAQATSPNLNPETISARVAAGTYLLYVVADSGRSGYTLTVTHPK
jgi:subtilisin family serine protease